MPRTVTHSTSKTSPKLPRGLNYDPWEHAEMLGIEVVVRRLRTANGLWFPEYGQILISDRLRAGQQRLVLAHEVGHGALAHPDDRPKFEQQADRFAAQNLIDPEHLDDLYKWCPDENKLVAELGVTHRLFRAFVLSKAA